MYAYSKRSVLWIDEGPHGALRTPHEHAGLLLCMHVQGYIAAIKNEMSQERFCQ